MKSIARHHDLALAFGPAWTRPHPQPDRHALAEFDADRFAAHAPAHLILAPP